MTQIAQGHKNVTKGFPAANKIKMRTGCVSLAENYKARAIFDRARILFFATDSCLLVPRDDRQGVRERGFELGIYLRICTCCALIGERWAVLLDRDNHSGVPIEILY